MAEPVNTSSPVASGDAVVGAELTTTNGVWENDPVQFFHQWAIEGEGTIAGATNPTYTVPSAQLGNSLYCRVTAMNVDGNGVASSNTIGPIGSSEMVNVVEVPAYGKTATFIVSEANGHLSREEVTVVRDPVNNLPDGLVMKALSPGRYAPFDGTGTASALLFDTINAGAGDVKATVFVRNAECQRFLIKFVAGVSEGQKTAAFASLANQQIIMR